MSTKDQQYDEAQQQADFHSGFNGDAPGSQETEPPEAEPKEPEATDNASELPAEKEGDQGEVEEPALAGLTESEIRSLLERSAKVDSLADQLRKANGKIGELNGYVQEIRKGAPNPKSSQEAVAAAVADDPELAEIASLYPDIDKLIEARSRRIAAEIMKQAVPQPDADPAAPDADSLRDEIASDIRAEMEEKLMDTLHADWRDVVSSSDFELWLATQPEEVRQQYATTASANELSGILGNFKSWKTNVSDRSQRNKKRLESALTPSGVPARQTPAPSADDEFRAGFYGT